jgi:hypothetical protein
MLIVEGLHGPTRLHSSQLKEQLHSSQLKEQLQLHGPTRLHSSQLKEQLHSSQLKEQLHSSQLKEQLHSSQLHSSQIRPVGQPAPRAEALLGIQLLLPCKCRHIIMMCQ